ncbi:MAG: citrate/2-methylcitrate synthase [Eubacteriaceae bacterium]|nr:citrate/2-methylcitrate synthase [Eubacteriaceae bacterium]
MKRNYAEITPQLNSLAKICVENNVIQKDLYSKYNVKRGLRDENGKGVVTGLTNISEVNSRQIINGEEVACPGELFYRGYNVKDLVKGLLDDRRYGFEEIIYLLLFGSLPDESKLKGFNELLVSYRSLPTSFARDVIMKAPSENIMNSLARSVLTLYSYDKNAEDMSIENVLRQSLQLISMFPLLSVYGYQAYDYYHKENKSLFIHDPLPELTIAENILHMLRKDSKYTQLEARILDLALILHAEHGGGNNSSFTIHVVSSSGTDTYSAVAAAIGSLKGPKHGGANIKVCEMFDDIKANVSDWYDKEEIERYLSKIINKEAFDKTGLVYGIGHAVYSISDPRAEIFKEFVEKLSKEKGMEKEYSLYSSVEELAPKLLSGSRNMIKGVSANVDFYSGFVYDMLGIPKELFTPLFAIARIVGWSAHRIEELNNSNKIIRPAYKEVQPRRDYIAMNKR